MENINYFDLIVVALIVILGLKGLFRGFIKELFALMGIIGGVYIASRVAKDAGGVLNKVIPIENEHTLLLAGFVVALVLFWLLAYLLGTILEKVFSASGLGFFDRFLGFLFGAGKIFLLFSVIVYAASQVKMINDNFEPKMKDSFVYPILKKSGGYIVKLDTSNLQKKVGQNFDEVINSTKEVLQDVSKQEIEKIIEGGE